MAAFLKYGLFLNTFLFIMKRYLLPFFALFSLAFFEACNPDEKEPTVALSTPANLVSSDVANAYVALSLKLTKETAGFTPPVAARAFGYFGLALYEATVGGMTGNKSLQGVVNGFGVGSVPALENGKSYHWGECANRAMSVMLLKLYPTATLENLSAVTSAERAYETQFKLEADEETLERSKAYGEAVANAVFSYAATDGQTKAYSTNFPAIYVPPVFAGAWVPTPPAFQRALQPYWGNVRTFHPNNVVGTQPPKHPAYSTETSSKFYAQGLERYTISKNLITEQRHIALFLRHDPGKTATPPSHPMSSSSGVSRRRRVSSTSSRRPRGCHASSWATARCATACPRRSGSSRRRRSAASTRARRSCASRRGARATGSAHARRWRTDGPSSRRASGASPMRSRTG